MINFVARVGIDDTCMRTQKEQLQTTFLQEEAWNVMNDLESLKSSW